MFGNHGDGQQPGDSLSQGFRGAQRGRGRGNLTSSFHPVFGLGGVEQPFGGFQQQQQGFRGNKRGRGRGQSHAGIMPQFAPPGFGYGGNFQPSLAPSPLDAEIVVVLNEMRGELFTLSSNGETNEQLRNAQRLLSTEVDRLENNIDPEWLEVDIEKPIKLIRKVLIPTFRNPGFNYIGKVLGPKGATLKNIAKCYKCHITILGRGSTRDKAKEDELIKSGDPNYAHLEGPLHLKIETNAAPALAYQRVSGVLEVLQQLLQPVKETHIPGITVPMEENEQKTGEDGNLAETETDNQGTYAQISSGFNNAAIGSNGAGFGRGGYPHGKRGSGGRRFYPSE